MSEINEIKKQNEIITKTTKVRTAAANKVAEESALVGPRATLQRFVPACRNLVTDSSQYTRGEFLSLFIFYNK
jgi:hypothetical protein